MTGHEASPGLTESIRAADEQGRALITVVGGRLAILLPMPTDKQRQAEEIRRVVAALESAGYSL